MSIGNGKKLSRNAPVFPLPARAAVARGCGSWYTFRKDVLRAPESGRGGRFFMNLYVALSLFSLIVLLYLVISDLFTIFFRFSGLPEERARFQVISLLTGCGFTTRESEMLLTTRRRRRLARITMLFGYVFNISIVSMIINIFLSMKDNQALDILLGVLIPLGTAVAFIVLMRIPRVRAWGDGILQKIAGRFFSRGEAFNSFLLLEHIGTDSIAVVTLRHVPEPYLGVPLSQLNIRSEKGILVMLVEHPGKKAEPAGPDTVFSQGDRLTVFGGHDAICETFDAKEHFD